MDADALTVVRRLFDHIDGSVPRDQAEQTAYARDLFEHLSESVGPAVPLEPVEYRKARLDDLGAWSEDPWGTPTYGLDASTTRPLEFNNGLALDTAYAKLGVAGAGANREVEERGTVKTVVHHPDPESTLHGTTFESGSVEGEVLRFPTTDRENTARLAEDVSTAAQYLAEGEHLTACADVIDSACFIDGAVFPIGVAYWLLLAERNYQTPALTWDVPQRILRQYVRFVDRQYERDAPVVGVVKTSTMDTLVESLDETLSSADSDPDSPDNVPWSYDHQFVGEVLRNESLDHLSYTSWFVQEGLAIDGQEMELLAPLADELQHGDPADYRRAFFYVRLPRTGDVLRIETPQLLIDSPGQRETVRLKVLKEIAATRDVPAAVGRADRIARVTRDNRDTIRDLLTRSEPTFDHNWDGRWSDIEEVPGDR
jgi:hypothetical protein